MPDLHLPVPPKISGTPYAAPLLKPVHHVGRHSAGAALRAWFAHPCRVNLLAAPPRMVWGEAFQIQTASAPIRLTALWRTAPDARSDARPDARDIRVLVFRDLSTLILWRDGPVSASPGSDRVFNVLPLVLRLASRPRTRCGARADLATAPGRSHGDLILLMETAQQSEMRLTDSNPEAHPGPSLHAPQISPAAREARDRLHAAILAEASAWIDANLPMPPLLVAPEGLLPAPPERLARDRTHTAERAQTAPATPLWTPYSHVPHGAAAPCRTFLDDLARWAFTWVPAETTSIHLELEAGRLTRHGPGAPAVRAMADMQGPGGARRRAPHIAAAIERAARRLVAAGLLPAARESLVAQNTYAAGNASAIYPTTVAHLSVRRPDAISAHEKLRLGRRFATA